MLLPDGRQVLEKMAAMTGIEHQGDIAMSTLDTRHVAMIDAGIIDGLMLRDPDA